MNYFKKQSLIAIIAAAGVTLSSVGLFAYADENPVSDPDPIMSTSQQEQTPIERAAYVQPEKTTLSLKASSIERDLHIYIMNPKGILVDNVGFEIDVTDPKNQTFTIKDEQKAGRIYIKDLEPGEYTLALKEADDFIMPDPVKVEVSGVVKTEVIEDIDKEILKASDVDAKKEDPNYPGNAAIPDMPQETPPAPPADTIQFLESKSSVVEKEIPGPVVVKYKPVLSSNGKFLLWDDSESTIDHKVDSEGYCLPSDTDIFGPDGIPLTVTIPVTPTAAAVPEGEAGGTGETAPPAETTTINKYKLTPYDYQTTIKESVTIYQGWQTLNGKKYYYTADGKPITGSQVIQGIRYTFDSSGVLQQNTSTRLLGIDVSTYQKPIDWATARANGVHFAMIRAGYRGYTQGGLIEDDRFATHARGAQAAGVKVGVYYFSQAVDAREAVEEASAAIAIVRKHGIGVSYPIAIDIEYAAGGAGRGDRISAAQRTEVARAFCDTIRNAGYVPMVYSSISWFSSSYMSTSAAGQWVAQWPTAGGSQRAMDCKAEERADRGWGIWQFTSMASIPGVPGRVDANYSYLGY